MRIIGMGASTMAGVGDSEGGFFRRLGKTVNAWYPGIEFVNRGVGGDTTAMMLARAKVPGSWGNHFVVVLLGCNDVPRDRDLTPGIRPSLEEYRRNLDELLGLIRGEYSLFVTSFPVCAPRTGVRPEILTRYMEAALEVARDHEYEIWDLHGELGGAGAEPYLAADGKHFNELGHAMIAGRVTEKLHPQLNEGLDDTSPGPKTPEISSANDRIQPLA